jgi:hypothetical protein
MLILLSCYEYACVLFVRRCLGISDVGVLCSLGACLV